MLYWKVPEAANGRMLGSLLQDHSYNVAATNQKAAAVGSALFQPPLFLIRRTPSPRTIAADTCPLCLTDSNVFDRFKHPF